MYGIFSASGALGALLGLKVGTLLYNYKCPEAMYGVCISLAMFTFLVILVSRIGRDPYFVKPTKDFTSIN